MSEPRSDVVVIGGGVAGLAAALAARAEGATVCVVRAHAGASVLAGGAWDVATDLGASPGEVFRPPRTLREALVLFAKRHVHHPYARLGGDLASLVEKAHQLVLPALAIYHPLDLDGRGVLVATDLGLARRAATAQLAVLDLAPHHGALAVADLPCARDTRGTFLAASLAELAELGDDERRFGAVSVEFGQRKGDAFVHPHELAAVLDREEGRTRLVQALARALGGSEHAAVLLPPLLGLEDDTIVAQVRKSIGITAGEVVSALAGPQGLRLARRIDAVLSAAGVTRLDARVLRVSPRATGTRVELEGDVTLSPGATVLATGKHVGGGIVAHRGELREPLAALPVHEGGGPLARASLGEGHDPLVLYGSGLARGGPGFRAGIGHDDALRALGEDGAAAAPDLFAAGAVLAGTDPSRDGTGFGTATTTGFVAGRNAARHAATLGAR